MIDAADSQVILYIVVQESPRESLFRDRYFVSGIGSGIAKRSKDPAQHNINYMQIFRNASIKRPNVL